MLLGKSGAARSFGGPQLSSRALCENKMKLQKIRYSDLNPKAQEMYNFQKIAAVLADYGFTCMWLNNDWNGADFIAVHVDGVTDIKVQLKGGLSFANKYGSSAESVGS